MKKKISIIPLMIAVSMALSSCSSSGVEVEVEDTLTAVKVSTVSNGSIATDLEYTGQATANQTFAVLPALTSKVESTYKEVGDTVNEGDLLFTLDAEDVQNQIRQLEASVATANAAVATAQASYNSIDGGQFQSQLVQLEGGIETTQKSLDNAAITLQNAQDSFDLIETQYNNSSILYDQGIISKNDFDQIENSYNQAKAGVEQAQIAYDTTASSLEQQQETYDITVNQTLNDSKNTAQQSVNQAKASANSAQVQLDIARDTLNDLDETAEISGVISAKNVEVGEYASPSSPAYVITDMDEILVSVNVSEKIINTLAVGDEVNVNIDALSDEPVKGTIDEISPVVDATNTFPIKIKISNMDHTIKPGMFADITFMVDSADNVIVVPKSAILTDSDKNYVFVENNGVVTATEVEIGIDNGEEAQILSGLSVGDTIVTTGQDYIFDGENVNVVSGEEE